MGKLEFLSINLSKPSPIYFSGETVDGTVNYCVLERFKVNAVKVNAEGHGHVEWKESEGAGEQRKEVVYSDRENYFNLGVFLLARQGDHDMWVEPGNYSLPFSVVLPLSLPTSFEHAHGRIRYSLTATIDIPWAVDYHAYRAITVISHLDLNQSPALRQPYNTTETKTICCMCCKSAPIVISVGLKKGGYISGETLICDVKIDNQSNNDVKPPELRLVEHIRLNAKTKSKLIVRTITAQSLPRGVKAHASEQFEAVGFVIPAICPSSLLSSRVIQSSYFFDLNVDAAGFSISDDIRIPLTIGTCPFREGSGTGGGVPGREEFIFQPSFFGAFKSELPLDHPAKGEIVASDSVAFVPHYPVLGSP